MPTPHPQYTNGCTESNKPEFQFSGVIYPPNYVSKKRANILLICICVNQLEICRMLMITTPEPRNCATMRLFKNAILIVSCFSVFYSSGISSN